MTTRSPCFSCPLPDCDERSPGCLLRRGFAAAQRKRRNGQYDAVTDEERTAFNERYTAMDLERAASRSEARP